MLIRAIRTVDEIAIASQSSARPPRLLVLRKAGGVIGMSSFGAKRRARKIETEDEGDEIADSHAQESNGMLLGNIPLDIS